MRIVFGFLAFLFVMQADAQDFDHELLSGVWAENSSTRPACTNDNPHPRMRFELSDDGALLKFKLDGETKLNSGEVVDSYTAKVVRTNKNSLIIAYNSDAGEFPENYPVEWELAFVAPGVFRWRATNWPEGRVNPVIGIRCER